MPSAPLPPDEPQRLAALHDLEILDTPDEEHFRHFTDLAAEMFDAPIVAISLVDRDREWFKACYGTDTRQADRRIAFCAYTILSDEMLVVEDAAADARFADNPQVTEGGVRFYAGAPFRSPDGHRIGALCLKDTRPRSFDAADRRQLERLASIVSHDLDTRRQAEERRRHQRMLEEARRAAESANRAKSEFLASMSHELRTPLNAIIGFTDGLLGRVDRQPLTEHQTDRLTRVKKAGEHLLGLINDVLDIAKVEAGEMRMHVRPFSAADLAREIADLADPLVAAKGDRLRFELVADGDLPTLQSDRDKVKQVIVNLVSNAIKFTDEGSVRLSVQANGDYLHVSVEDTGIGIADEEIPNLFERFRQLEGGAKRGGTGLGLALCREFADLLGGVLTVRSVLGSGSTFTLSLPVTPADDGALDDAEETRRQIMARAREAAPSGREMVVLCVEDNPASMLLLQDHLAEAGCRVIPMFDGQGVVEAAASERPDLVVLDINLPGLDGWEVLRRLKADPATAHLPVVLATACTEHDRGLALGADDYLTKPIGRDELVRSITRLAGRGGRPAEVAVVDDDPTVRALLSDVLAEQGCAVRTFEDGAPFLAAVSDPSGWRPDVVLLDLMMPDVGGFAVIEAVEALDHLADLPIVVLTAMILSTDELVRLDEQVQLVVEKNGMSRQGTLERIVRAIDRLPARGRTAA